MAALARARPLFHSEADFQHAFERTRTLRVVPSTIGTTAPRKERKRSPDAG
jgi:hypothetical protein